MKNYLWLAAVLVVSAAAWWSMQPTNEESTVLFNQKEVKQEEPRVTLGTLLSGEDQVSHLQEVHHVMPSLSESVPVP